MIRGLQTHQTARGEVNKSPIFNVCNITFLISVFVSKLQQSIKILKNFCKVFLRHEIGKIFLLQAQSFTA
jgi:hypothetical protein